LRLTNRHLLTYLLGQINEVTLRRARLVLRWVTVHGYTVPPWYVTIGISHSDQLGLLPAVGREIITGQRAVAVLCGWEGNRRSCI